MDPQESRGPGGEAMSGSTKLCKLALLVFSAAAPLLAQEMPGMSMPGDKQQAPEPGHHQMQVAKVKPEYPRLGRAQEKAPGALFTLEDAQKISRESNPTLRQAEAEIRATRARRAQAGLYPNPSIGYTADEIRGGSTGGGKQGFFLQQTVVLGGKLDLNRSVFAQDVRLAEIEAEEQRTRVESAVRMAFIRVLAAQELLDARNDLARIEADAAETERRLMNTGQADESEVLEAEVEAQRMRIAARMQENTLREEWRSLAAVVGRPDLPRATVSGALDKDWPELADDEAVERIAKESPAVRIADAALGREQAALARARKEPVPDLQVRAGLEYNHQQREGLDRAKGWEGIAELGLEIPLFNRNQGNVLAARAGIDRAQEEKRRIELTLRERAASAVDRYANARLLAVEYRDRMMPLARKAYGLMVEKYGQMEASYPRVLGSERKLYELQVEYIGALESVWTNGIALEGYLLTDGLEAPARPGEVDRPVRETNVPAPERTIAPGEMPSRRP